MKKKLLSLLLAMPFVSLQAQDMGFGVELEGSYKITKPLEASFDCEIRTQEGLSDMERISFGAGLDYKVGSGVKVELGYVVMAKLDLAHDSKKYHYVDDWGARQRAFAGVSFSTMWGKHVKVSIRERYQYTYTAPANLERYYLSDLEHRASDKVEEAGHEHLLRSRVQLDFIIRKKCPWTPYLSLENLNDLSHHLRNDQTRYTLGTDYKLDKHNKLGLAYRFKDKSNTDEAKGHLITISFSHAF